MPTSMSFFISIILATTMFSVIDSAVCTIVVCFAEAPSTFEENHPNHYQSMKEAWSDVYGIRFQT